MSRHQIGGQLDVHALARLTHRPDDPAILAREAEHLLSIGMSVQDAAQALDLLPAALAQLLDDNPIANP